MKILPPKNNVPAYSFNPETYRILNESNSSCNYDAISNNISILKTDLFWNMYGMARAVFDQHVMPICLKYDCAFISDRSGFSFIPKGKNSIPEAEVDDVSKMLSVSTGLGVLTKIGNMMPSFDPKASGFKICGHPFYHYLIAVENGTIPELASEMNKRGFHKVEKFKTEDDCNKYYFHHSPAAVGHLSPFECIFSSTIGL